MTNLVAVAAGFGAEVRFGPARVTPPMLVGMIERAGYIEHVLSGKLAGSMPDGVTRVFWTRAD